MASRKPTSVVLFTYRVGFGDCFLLRFCYPSGNKHLLVDFGSTATPPRMERPMKRIAEHIRGACEGKLDAIVVTHRHADHLSGFAGETWKIIRGLDPELVLLPWTEDPDAAPDAKAATRAGAPAATPEGRYIAALSSMHRLAETALHELQSKGDRAELARLAGQDEDEDDEEDWGATTRPFSKAVTKQLAFLGEENLANAAAVKNLLSLPREFLCFGATTKLEKLLPGVKISVLGPPTLEQSSAISKERATDPDEFWHLSARAAAWSAAVPGTNPLFPKSKPLPLAKQPVEVRWFTKRLDAARGEELLELVRILDEAMNNTSLVLLFEVGERKLLFSGDAQIENWSYALSKPAIRARLAGVDVYKVGHHGSLNATPKTLWALFRKKGANGKLKTFLSTLPGKHGSKQRGTEVPRSKLLEALSEESALFSTTKLKGKDQLVIEETIVP